jgi:hypothetical protein
LTKQRLRYALCKFLRWLDCNNFEPCRQGAFKSRLGVLERDSRVYVWLLCNPQIWIGSGVNSKLTKQFADVCLILRVG